MGKIVKVYAYVWSMSVLSMLWVGCTGYRSTCVREAR